MSQERVRGAWRKERLRSIVMLWIGVALALAAAGSFVAMVVAR